MDKVRKFRNVLIQILNIIDRYHDGKCDNKNFPNIETFDVDTIYEVIDIIYDKFKIDENFNEDEFIEWYKNEFCCK